ncbi:unnamed protein product, partial [Protopolystoma xenopodis]
LLRQRKSPSSNSCSQQGAIDSQSHLFLASCSCSSHSPPFVTADVITSPLDAAGRPLPLGPRPTAFIPATSSQAGPVAPATPEQTANQDGVSQPMLGLNWTLNDSFSESGLQETWSRLLTQHTVATDTGSLAGKPSDSCVRRHHRRFIFSTAGRDWFKSSRQHVASHHFEVAFWLSTFRTRYGAVTRSIREVRARASDATWSDFMQLGPSTSIIANMSAKISPAPKGIRSSACSSLGLGSKHIFYLPYPGYSDEAYNFFSFSSSINPSSWFSLHSHIIFSLPLSSAPTSCKSPLCTLLITFEGVALSMRKARRFVFSILFLPPPPC